MNKQKPIRIIQTSAARSGSTVLSNILMAFFQPYEPICFMGKSSYNEDLLRDNIVIKTHDKKIDLRGTAKEIWKQVKGQTIITTGYKDKKINIKSKK